MTTQFNSIFLVPKLNAAQDPTILNVVDLITATATRLNVNIIVDKTDARLKDDTLVIAIGGDGTMLEAMRIAARTNATAIGVNLGRIGFLTDVSVQEHLTHAVAAAILRLTDTFVEERTLLETSQAETLAVNEVSVSQLYADSMITYRLLIGNVDAGIHRANGILVSTPTGSTAYSLSVGGALMMPEMDAIQIVPVAPSTMTSRPIIVPSATPIELHVWGGNVTVRADGQILSDEVTDSPCVFAANFYAPTKTHPYKITINPFKNKAKILHFAGWNFFDVLTEKLGWKHD